MMDNKVDLIASPQSWIEGEALRQLEETSRLPGMFRAVGMPDLHPGKGHPIGAAFRCGSIEARVSNVTIGSVVIPGLRSRTRNHLAAMHYLEAIPGSRCASP